MRVKRKFQTNKEALKVLARAVEEGTAAMKALDAANVSGIREINGLARAITALHEAMLARQAKAAALRVELDKILGSDWTLLWASEIGAKIRRLCE